MGFYTTVMIKNSPNKIYQLSDNVFLVPYKTLRTKIQKGIFDYSDSIKFYTESENIIEHRKLLKKRIIFHSFIFNEPTAIFFTKRFIEKEIKVKSYKHINQKKGNNQCIIDYDNIVNTIYFGNKSEIKISYKKLYEKTKDDYLEKILILLNPLGDILGPRSSIYSLFDDTYLRTTNYLTLLENIIDHPTVCINKIKCDECGKELIHRIGSEKQRRENFLKNIILDNKILKDYINIINLSYNKVRTKAVHIGELPTAKMNGISRKVGQICNIEKYEEDSISLQNLEQKIKEIVRNLLLHKFYGLNFFPPLKDIKVLARCTPGKI